MNLKNIAIASVAVGGLLLFSAFGGNKITLDEQMKAIDAAVSENVASFESNKRAECKAMAVQKAIGLAEAKMAETKAALVPGKKGITKAPVKKAVPVKKAPVKPAPVVKPATPTSPKNAEETTGRRKDPAANAPETQTTGRQANPAANTQETQTTGRRKNN